VYILCRNLSLYLRNGPSGNLLHAAGVVFGGKAILFHGQSGSGKTTLMLHAIMDEGARPLTNDRAFISVDAKPMAYSWPSFITLCEGTILNNPPLRKGAEEYSAGKYPYRTLDWTAPLEAVFRKDKKRLYPMHWLSTCCQVKYSAAAPLGALVLPRVRDTDDPADITVCDLSNGTEREQLLKLMKEESFDGKENGLLPWHGLPLPTGTPPLEDLVDRIRTLRLPVYRVNLPARNLSPFRDVLQDIAARK